MIAAQQARQMRDEVEQSLLVRLNQILDRLDGFAGTLLPEPAPEDVAYLAEQERIDAYFAADRQKFDEDSAFPGVESEWVWAPSTGQTFPGRNRLVERLDGGIELWFRIEFGFRCFAGFTIYNANAHQLITFGDLPAETKHAVLGRFGLSDAEVSDICWWVTGKNLPTGFESTSPNFRMMDDLSLALLDDEVFEAFCAQSEQLIAKLIAEATA